MRIRLAAPAVCLLVATLLARMPGTAEASVADDVCTGDPCVIFGTVPVSSGSLLDFGTRHVRIEGTLEIGTGPVEIRARSLTITSSGRMRGSGGTTQSGGVLHVTVEQDIEIFGSQAGGAIVLSGSDGGELVLVSTAGSVTGGGQVVVSGTSADGFGGLIAIDAAQDVVLTNRIDVSGGQAGAGGTVEVLSGRDVTLQLVDLRGGAVDGGTLDVIADGGVTLGAVDASASGEGGRGGTVVIDSAGPVAVNDVVQARGSSSLLYGGDGGLIEIYAGTAISTEPITVRGSILADGRGSESCGGNVVLIGSALDLRSTIDVSGDCAGDVDAFGDSSLLLSGTVLGRSADLGSGTIGLASGGAMTVSGRIDANGGHLVEGGDAGTVLLDAIGPLTVSGSINSNALGSAALAGALWLRGCRLMTTATARFEARGSGGSIRFTSRGIANFAGTATADATSGSVEIFYREPALFPSISGFASTPAPIRLLDPAIALCPCADGIDNDGDGRVDFPVDAGCRDYADPTEEFDCADGIDNDGDGAIDYPADVGCRNAMGGTESPACNDGRDNDGDGLIDYPEDPSCAAAWSDKEKTACSDGIDNDGDGLVDLADPGCRNDPSRDRESPASSCGIGAELALIGLLGARLARGSRGVRIRS